jgi:hypothetical protein
MAGNVTTNQSPLIKAQVFSEFLLELIVDGFLPDGLHRDVSDFGDGTTIYIPVMGDTVLRDYVEDTGIQFDAIDTGQISLTITEYVSAATYVTDKLKQDAYKAAALEAAIPREHLRKIRERYESDMLGQTQKQTLSDPNLVNGFAHRWVAHSGTTNGVLTLEDFVYAKLAADKALMPDENRIAIVDPVGEAAVNLLAANQAFNYNPQFEGIATTGFAKQKKFIRHIYGWDIYVSNRLYRDTVAETIVGGPTGASQTSAVGFVNNVFACMADDQHTPFMGAMRQMPASEGFRNTTFKRDEYSTTARWGFGLQRPEALIVVKGSASAYK